MSKKVSLDFFSAKGVLFVGYSKKHEAFCASVKRAFESNGSVVYAVNPNGGPSGVEVFADISKVPANPELAYVLTGKAHSAAVLEKLAAKGVKRVLFNSKMSADAIVLSRCGDLGMEHAVACPLMALGGGLHRFHGFLSGVPKAGMRK